MKATHSWVEELLAAHSPRQEFAEEILEGCAKQNAERGIRRRWSRLSKMPEQFLMDTFAEVNCITIHTAYFTINRLLADGWIRNFTSGIALRDSIFRKTDKFKALHPPTKKGI